MRQKKILHFKTQGFLGKKLKLFGKKLKDFGFKTQRYGSSPLHLTTKKMFKKQAWSKCTILSSLSSKKRTILAKTVKFKIFIQAACATTALTMKLRSFQRIQLKCED